MKILVTGAHGFVGARIMHELKDAVPSPSLKNIDEEDVKRIVHTEEPDIIIHTAALSDIPTCERDHDASYRANVELPVWLVRTGIKTVLFSTDSVYSGSKNDGPYNENDVNPANVYAKHKLEMEKCALDINPNTIILRATWMYDMPMYGVANRGNFLINMLRYKEISFSSTQHRAVTYVREVAQLMQKAMFLPGGIYNYGSENDLTMMETAYWLKNRLSLPIHIEEAGPRYHLWMDCSKIKKYGISFLTTIDGLEKCIEDYSLSL